MKVSLGQWGEKSMKRWTAAKTSQPHTFNNGVQTRQSQTGAQSHRVTYAIFMKLIII